MINNKYRYDKRLKSHHDSLIGVKDFYTKDINREEYISKKLSTSCTNERVIYLHIPFCNKICSFCPFNKPVSLKRSSYDQYIINQIDVIKNYEYFKAPYSAINFGGGTPTTLKPKQMDRVLKHLRNSFSITNDAEVSIETTISELTSDMIDVLLENGVNRLSVGIQSFDDDTRKRFNRRGDGMQAIKKLEEVVSRGLINTSIDLLYNGPGQTMETLEKDLKIISAIPIAGVSLYSLRVHEGTPLYKGISKDEFVAMEDLEREQAFFYKILDELKPYGYDMLELSKLVRNKIDKYEYMSIRHNGGECLPIGHGASGSFGSYLYRNSQVAENISKDIPISSMGRIVEDEYFIVDALAYEMISGKVDFTKFSSLLKINLKEIFKDTLYELERDGLIVQHITGFSMTELGQYFGNNIINELVSELLKYKKSKVVIDN